MYSWVNKLYEENSKLLGNRYDVPEEILEFLNYDQKNQPCKKIYFAKTLFLVNL